MQANAAKADGQRAWWKLPRGNWRVVSVLRVLRVWSLANGRLECLNKRRLCAGKGQAAMLERWGPGAWWKLPRGMCSQRAGCNPGTAKADGQTAWWQLRLECPNNRALCAGKGQAAMLEQQKLTARGLGGSCREVLSVVRVLSVWSLANGRLECLNKRGLCAGKCSKGWRPEGLVEAAARELEGFKRFKGFKGTRKGYVQANAAKADGQRAWWKLPRGNWRVLSVVSVLRV